MVENFPDDIPTGKITYFHTQSDNAAFHFKNRKSLNFYSRLMNDRGGPVQYSCVYTFGAPHYEKKQQFKYIGGFLA